MTQNLSIHSFVTFYKETFSQFEHHTWRRLLNMISKLASLIKIVLKTIALNISQVDWAWFLRHWHEINDPEFLNPFICYFLQRDFLTVWALHVKWNSLPFLFIHTFLYDVSLVTKWRPGMFQSDTLIIGAYLLTLSNQGMFDFRLYIFNNKYTIENYTPLQKKRNTWSRGLPDPNLGSATPCGQKVVNRSSFPDF